MHFSDIVTGLLVAVLACALSVGSAQAGIKQLSGTYSAATIKADCDAAGGTFTDSRSQGGDAGYSCVGSGGTVDCSPDGKCVGECGNCNPSRGGTIKFKAIVDAAGGLKLSGGATAGGSSGGGHMKPPVHVRPLSLPSVSSGGGSATSVGSGGGGSSVRAGGVVGSNAGMR